MGGRPAQSRTTGLTSSGADQSRSGTATAWVSGLSSNDVIEKGHLIGAVHEAAIGSRTESAAAGPISRSAQLD